jgi:regulator of nucleoside diphosphate kinase
MIDHAIYITANDAEKLRELIWKAQRTEYRHSTYLQMLSSELARAMIIDENAVPPDVITMNSQVSLVDSDTGEEMLYTLVFPEDADAIQGKISVLAPIGTAMLGYRVGDDFEWDTPGGKRKIRVIKVVYQPEASGDHPRPEPGSSNKF